MLGDVIVIARRSGGFWGNDMDGRVDPTSAQSDSESFHSDHASSATSKELTDARGVSAGDARLFVDFFYLISSPM